MEKPTFEEFISNLPQDLNQSSSSSCSSMKSEELHKNKKKLKKNNLSSDSGCLDYSMKNLKNSSDTNSLMNDSINNLNKAQRILSFDDENEENICCKKKVTN